jgi:RimJ/RimL family protein N-acetyltransferase
MDSPVRPDPSVLIRPIRADDGERLSASHMRLSPESRYRRFLAAKPELTVADVRYLVDVDGLDHIALVATRQSPDGEQIVGVARCIRIPAAPDTAEFAIVVADELQGHRIGTMLLARLAELAGAQGITRFRATMLSENLAVQRLLTAFAVGPVRRRSQGETTEIEIELPGAAPLAA